MRFRIERKARTDQCWTREYRIFQWSVLFCDVTVFGQQMEIISNDTISGTMTLHGLTKTQINNFSFLTCNRPTKSSIWTFRQIPMTLQPHSTPTYVYKKQYFQCILSVKDSEFKELLQYTCYGWTISNWPAPNSLPVYSRTDSQYD